MKKIQVSDTTFKEIISRDYLYVDKTPYIYNLVATNDYKCVFLTRPRRFGKTLLVDTINELFKEGGADSFKDLWIGSKEAGYEFEARPVLRLKMNYANTGGQDELKNRIVYDLVKLAKKEDVHIDDNLVASLWYDQILTDLLEGLSEKHNGLGAVVLIDEYDAPVAGNIENFDAAKANAKVLHGFFTALKNNIACIHFALVTGITRFGMTAMDSGPNNFVDISLLPKFSGICGFTISEFDLAFQERLPETLEALKDSGQMKPGSQAEDLKAEIMKWYDGYNWLGPERVLNPYSILYFFQQQKFDDYWPLSGVPNHLRTLMGERPLEFFKPKLKDYTSYQIRKVDLASLEPLPILFHSGYLTIEKSWFENHNEDGEDRTIERFSFKSPNLEVKQGYKNLLTDAIFKTDPSEMKHFGLVFLKAIKDRDVSEFAKTISNVLSNNTYWQHFSPGDEHSDHNDEQIDRLGEKHYHAIIQTALAISGLEVLGELSGVDGRADIVLLPQKKQRMVIELKYRYDKEKITDDVTKKVKWRERSEASREKIISQAMETALEAITKKDYLSPFRLTADKLVGMGLVVYGRNHVEAKFLEDSLLNGPRN
jgi:hypothetical protein